MSEIKLPAASGGGSISIKGPASSGSDVDLLDTSGNLKLSDSDELRLGTGDDLKLYHDGSNTYIDNATGDLKIRGDNIRFRSKSVDEMQISTYVNGAVQMAYDGSMRFETKSTGIGIMSGQRECNLTLQNDALTWKIVNYDYGNNGTDHLGFHDGTSDRLIIHDTGEGISFNGDTASANALGDYEEGTFTPTMPNSGSASFASEACFYTKIGRVVHLVMYVGFQSNASNYAIPDNSDQFRIGGLPFSSGSQQYNYSAGSISYSQSGDIASWGMAPLVADNGGSHLYFHKTDGDSGTRTNANFRAALGGQALIIQMTYFS